MVLYQLFLRVAFLVTALIHLWFNDVVKATISVAALCLSDPKRPIIQSILRLHSVVLVCFVLAFCFNAVSAFSDQTVVGRPCDVLKFDDIQTPGGFGNVSDGYHGLIFNDLLAFQPTHPDLEGIISTEDLNCAVSKPNALYGAKIRKQSPFIQTFDPSRTFAIHRLKIKPLDLPIGSVTINLYGVPSSEAVKALNWSVEFPAGFHDMLDVKLKEFSKVAWTGLRRMEVWADFRYNDVEMGDWEFCIDDLEIELESSLQQ